MLRERLHDLWLRLKAVFKRRQLDRDLAEELEFHLAMRERKLIEQGMAPCDAHYAARRGFGNAVLLKETSRALWSFPSLESLLQDVRYGLRQLRRNPGFTVVAVLTLALGIGGTTAIFSVIEGAVLDPFPYRESRRLIVLTRQNLKDGQPPEWAWVSAREFMDYQKNSQEFDEVFGAQGVLAADASIATRADTPEIFIGVRVTGSTFRVLGVPPFLGRAIMPADCKPDAAPVAVLNFRYWRKKFGGDAGVIGRSVNINHRPTTIVGVMPPRFGWQGAEIFLPAEPSGAEGTGREAPFAVFGRLRPGATMEQAAAEVAVLAKAFAASYPKEHPKAVAFGVQSLLESTVASFRATIYTVMGSVALLLLITCVNVANLLLARAIGREKEFAIRAALGAGRLRLFRQLMIESLLVGLGGALLGGALAANSLSLLVAIIPPWEIPTEATIQINGWVMLFIAGIALASTLLFGLAPAFMVAKRELCVPGGAGRTSETRGTQRLRNLLVVSQVTISLVLLTGAGLLLRSFYALRHVDLGYNTHQLISVVLSLPVSRYKTSAERAGYFQEALRRTRDLPGVVSAAICTSPPMGDEDVAKLEIPGKPAGESQTTQLHLISDRYYHTMGIPLLRGRDFSERDVVRGQRVAVVNRAFARKYFGNEDPLGQQIRLTDELLAWTPVFAERKLAPLAFEIVGVAENARDNGPESPIEPQVYVPFTVSGVAYQWILARTRQDPAAMMKPVRSAIIGIDKDLPMGGGYWSDGPLDESLNSQFTEPRFTVWLLSAFGALGLALVSMGVYGVLSYSVSRKTQEIGIRMALGAEAANVRWWVVKAGLRWLAVGIGIGVPASIALAKILQNRIWGIKSADPLTLVVVSTILIAVGLAACYFPARRATKVDPMVALRCE